MEGKPLDVVLRCTVADRPGALAAVAGAIGRAGGDIEAVEVVDHDGERALDDFVIALAGGSLRRLLDELAGVPGVEVVHAGPSRGGPGDATTRLAVAVEAMLSGAMTTERGIVTLIGGLLHLAEVEVADRAAAPPERDRRLVLPLGERVLVGRRDYPFTSAERQRALALARLCGEIARHVEASSRSG